ncbi:MAG: hypothetical protein JSR53_11965 [Proteobacteria bacterium]|nr:hypothetical protein [Pseudomonadota bacterium]
MTIEQFVLIVALMGSAKMAFEPIIAIYRKLSGKSKDKIQMEQLVKLLEAVSMSNDILLERNKELELKINGMQVLLHNRRDYPVTNDDTSRK